KLTTAVGRLHLVRSGQGTNPANDFNDDRYTVDFIRNLSAGGRTGEVHLYRVTLSGLRQSDPSKLGHTAQLLVQLRLGRARRFECAAHGRNVTPSAAITRSTRFA